MIPGSEPSNVYTTSLRDHVSQARTILQPISRHHRSYVITATGSATDKAKGLDIGNSSFSSSSKFSTEI